MQELVRQLFSFFLAQDMELIVNEDLFNIVTQRAVPALKRYIEDHGWVLDAKVDYQIEERTTNEGKIESMLHHKNGFYYKFVPVLID
jgi:hypothetical protein